MKRPYAHVVKWARTIHIYATVFALLLMLFFAVTGIVLNHEEWFTRGEAPPVETTGQIQPELLREPDRLGVVEVLRSTYHATGAVTTFDVDDELVRVELKGPGRRMEAEIDRATGHATIVTERRSLLVVMDDLHRGKDAGAAWSLVIDLSSVLLLVGSVTGILMWIALPRRRRLGLVALGLSVAMCGGIYVLLVP